LIIGYNLEDKTPYIEALNVCLGKDWGENGIIWIALGNIDEKNDFCEMFNHQ